MKTAIINLKGFLFEGEAKLLNVQTLSGEITILPGHQPLISVLAPQARLYLEEKDGKRQEFRLAGGFLHLNGHHQLTVLAD